MYSLLIDNPRVYECIFFLYCTVICPLILFIHLLTCRIKNRDLPLPVLLLGLCAPVVTYLPWCLCVCFLSTIGWIQDQMPSLVESSWGPVFVTCMAIPIFLPLWKRSRFCTAVALHRLMQVAAIIYGFFPLSQWNGHGSDEVLLVSTVGGGCIAQVSGIGAILVAYFLNPVVTRTIRARRLNKVSRFPLMSLKKKIYKAVPLLYILSPFILIGIIYAMRLLWTP